MTEFLAPAVDIGGRLVGAGHPPMLVAEISGNHNRNRDRAIELIRQVGRSGVEAVKFQTYTADTLTINCSRPDFRINSGLWKGRTLYELYEEASTPWDWHEDLFAVARESGLIAFSTPFDPSAVEFLEKIGAPAYKIASFEIVDLELIRAVAQTKKPIVISTGLASIGEIADALEAARSDTNRNVILLHCVSAYPTPAAEANLAKFRLLRDQFKVQIGLSDHTMGLVVPIAATALGACLIEKHVTSRRADGGPDAAFSLEMDELSLLAESVKDAYSAIGSPSGERTKSESQSGVFRRSLYVVQDIAVGEAFTRQNVRSIRPGFGLAPKNLPAIIGRVASCDIERGTPLDWSLIGRSDDR